MNFEKAPSLQFEENLLNPADLIQISANSNKDEITQNQPKCPHKKILNALNGQP